MRPLAAHITALLLAGLAIFSLTEAAAAAVTPPFGGTVWIGSSVLTPLSATDLLTVTPAGMGVRMTYDRRSGWVTQTAYLFNSTFTGTGTVEAIVNAEFGSVAAAQSEAERYSRVVGQLPRACRLNVDALWIHRGSDAFGGGNRSLLIHTDYAQANWSFIEELLIHECAHTSLDSSFGGTVSAAAWARAADADPGFISTYAETNPLREDVAESFLPYLAWRLGAASGYTASQLAEIHAQIANRIDYFDSLRLNLNPVIATASPATPPDPAETPSPAGPPADAATPAKPQRVRWWGPFTTGRQIRATFTPVAGVVYGIRASQATATAAGRCSVVTNTKTGKRTAKCTIRIKSLGSWLVQITPQQAGALGPPATKTLLVTARGG